VARKKPRAIHARILELRKKAGLSQEALAEAAGVDKTAVSHWENGVSAPTGSRLPAVANALGVAIDDLFRESKAAS
jgi:transcriptional regulator with XRE-family HTH domain